MNLPTSESSVFGTCNIHMEPNEGWPWRFLERLEAIVRELTLKYVRCEHLYKVINKSSAASNFKTEIKVKVPFLDSCPADAFLHLYFMTLDKLGLRKITKRLTPKYRPNTESKPKEGDAEKRNQLKVKIRLIGADVGKLIPHTPLLLDILQSSERYTPTQKEVETLVVMSSYAHLLKCLGGIFGQFVILVQQDEIGAAFLGALFVRLTYVFSLFYSTNSFYLGKVSAFLLEYLQDFFMISKTQCLGLGIVGLTQGGEHLNKKIKEWIFGWTGGKGPHKDSDNYFQAMVLQAVDVFIGGMSLFFEDFALNDVEDIFCANEKAWDNRFAFKFGTEKERCTCCNRNDLQPKFLQTLEKHLKVLTAKELPCLQLPQIKKALDKPYKKTSLSLGFLFSKYARLDLEKTVCKNCAYVFLLLVALFLEQETALSFVENDVSDPFVNDFEQSDEDLCAIVSEAEESDNDDDSAVVSEGTKTDKFVDDPFHSMC